MAAKRVKRSPVEQLAKDQKDFVIRHLRRASRGWKYKAAAKRRANIGRGLYECENTRCSRQVKEGQFQMDHIQPAVPVTGWVDFNAYIPSLLVGTDGWQLLCTKCHNKKTEEENKNRRLNKIKGNSDDGGTTD